MGIHDGHRERMLNKFSANGFAGLEEHEKLEIILFFSVPRRNTNDIAHILLNKYHTIADVMDAPEKELIKYKGITKRTVQLFRLIKEAYSTYKIEKTYENSFLTTVDEFGTYFQLYLAPAVDEKLVMMSLDSRGKKISTDVIEEGSVTFVSTNAKKILETVIRNKATEVVFCHNHPGGIVTPSKGDKIATVQMNEYLKTIGVRLRDHYIVTKDQYYSMESAGVLKKLLETGEVD